MICDGNTHGTKGHGEHGLHAPVLHRPDHAFLVHERAPHQRPELDMLHAHRHELRVRVRTALRHEDPVRVAPFAADLGT